MILAACGTPGWGVRGLFASGNGWELRCCGSSFREDDSSLNFFYSQPLLGLIFIPGMELSCQKDDILHLQGPSWRTNFKILYNLLPVIMQKTRMPGGEEGTVTRAQQGAQGLGELPGGSAVGRLSKS